MFSLHYTGLEKRKYAQYGSVSKQLLTGDGDLVVER